MHALTIAITDNYDEYPIVLKVYDEDLLSDEYMGEAIINVKDGIKDGFIDPTGTKFPPPKWVDLQYDRQLKCGKILVSFIFSV